MVGLGLGAWDSDSVLDSNISDRLGVSRFGLGLELERLGLDYSS